MFKYVNGTILQVWYGDISLLKVKLNVLPSTCQNNKDLTLNLIIVFSCVFDAVPQFLTTGVVSQHDNKDYVKRLEMICQGSKLDEACRVSPGRTRYHKC